MAHVLIMPRQGNTVESCIIAEWKVKDGDVVEAETTVCVVETDKATFEIPAGAAGTVLKILAGEGDDVPVLQPIMVVGNPGENWESAIGAPAAAGSGAPGSAAAGNTAADSAAPGSIAPPDKAPPPAQDAPAAQSLDVPAASAAQSSGFIAVSKRAQKLAEKEAVDVRRITGTGPDGRIIEADVLAAIAGRPPLTAAAKEELRKQIAGGGASLAAGIGSGIGGRLTAADIAAGTQNIGGASERYS